MDFLDEIREREMKARKEGREVEFYKKCGYCKYRIIPSCDRIGTAYYWKRKYYHMDCGENFTTMFHTRQVGDKDA